MQAAMLMRTDKVTAGTPESSAGAPGHAKRLKNDGDSMRALGYVVLYCAHIEEVVDDLLQNLARCAVALPKDLSRLSAGQKIAFCREAIEPHVATNRAMENLEGALKQAARRLEERNDAIYARIYARFSDSTIRPSDRHDSRGRPIASRELYALANRAYGVMDALTVGGMFSFFGAFKRDAGRSSGARVGATEEQLAYQVPYALRAPLPGRASR
jgi:hypothetical protein